MKSHFDLSDAVFERKFSDSSLSPSLFDHEAHLRLAWIYSNKYGVDKACEVIQLRLKNFTRHHGAADKYHETLTIAAVRVLNHFLRKSDRDDFKGFIEEFPELKQDFKSLIHVHYSPDIISSKEARESYMVPNLVPFD